ncbi:MAG TPA: hypothetical protein VFR37_08155 [Longimicrobium sp.]|nr:hypothetical protein [Longimicrobium sp.]
MSENPVFGRYEKVALLMLGFVLTTVGGALIGGYLQTRSRFKAQQEQVFTEVARQMDLRSYRTEQLLNGLRGDVEYASLETRRREYRPALEEWNINRNRNSALIERYFGKNASECFDSIHVSFFNIHRSIRDKADYSAIAQEDLPALRKQIKGFDRYLLDRARTGLLTRKAGRCQVPSVPRRRPQGGSNASGTARR